MIKNRYKTKYIALSVIMLIAICISSCNTNDDEINALSQELFQTKGELENKLIEAQATIDSQSAQIDEMQKSLDELNSQITSLDEDNRVMQNLLNAPSQFDNIEELVPKVAYLTFDDGPSALTNEVLDILERYNVKATFFVVYTEYGEKNDMYNKIVDAGHSLGNHTYTHISPNKGWDKYYADMMKMEEFLYEETGLRPRILRFPGGSVNSWAQNEELINNLKHLQSLGYQYFDWNVSTSDGGDNPLTSEEILAFVRSRSYGGKVPIINVLMHDRGDKYSTADALPDIIEYLRACGYVFLPLTPESTAAQIFDIEVDIIE